MAIGNEYLRQGCALAQRTQLRTTEVEHRLLLAYLPALPFLQLAHARLRAQADSQRESE